MMASGLIAADFKHFERSLSIDFIYDLLAVGATVGIAIGRQCISDILPVGENK